MKAAARPDAGELVFGALGPRLGDLALRVDTAADVAALVRMAPEIGDIGAGLIAQDAGAGLVTRVIAELNDRLTRRLIAVVERQHRLPAAAWCWVAFGSEGRGEQTFATDQDNGLMFSAAGPAEAEAMRALFLPFAHAVNAALADCGFALCKGEVMAGNPTWCRSAEEWHQRFVTWIRTPDPQALLNSTIFFDFRPLYGTAALATDLRKFLLGYTGANDAFIRMMVSNALSVTPPLGLLGDIVDSDSARGGVDLKVQGARLFVDAARILALAAGLEPVATVARLRAAARVGKIIAAEAEAAVQAFEYLQRLRLERQLLERAAGATPDNRVQHKDIDAFSRRMLKESFKQARLLQQQMKLSFQVDA